MAQCDVSEFVESGSCWCGLDRKQTQIVTLQLLCQILHSINPMASCEPSELLEAGKCFCQADAKQFQIIMLQLLCEILHGGGIQQTCLICGVGAPVDAAPCDCSIYYTLPPNAGMWVWNAIGGAWEIVINPGV